MIPGDQYYEKDGRHIMGLLQDWREEAYSQETDKKQLEKFWQDYFMQEKGIYEQLLADPAFCYYEKDTADAMRKLFDSEKNTE